MMKIALIGLSFPFIVLGGLYNFVTSETCTYEHDLGFYRCTAIRGTFPAIFYGNYDLECIHCVIKEFSAATFPYDNKLSRFNVNASGIKTITSRAFSKLTAANYLHLSGNEIANISSDAFFGMRHVYELHLDNNKLAELTPGFLNGLEATTITMRSNKLRRVPDDVFRGIFGAMSMDLSFNEIDSLYTDSFRHLNGLEVLDLQYNKLCSLPLDVFKHVRSLTELNLSGNKFFTFPIGIFSPLNRLITLNISDNNNGITKFDWSMILPTQIVNFDVSANGLRSLNLEEIHHYALTLRHLALNDNLWTCKDLVRIIKYLKSVNIDVLKYSLGRYSVMNVNGIACTDLDFVEKMPVDRFLEVVENLTLNKSYCTLPRYSH